VVSYIHNTSYWLLLFILESEALRRAAEYYMHDLVRVIFRRLDTLDPEEVAVQEGESAVDTANTELRMNVSPTRETVSQSLDQVLDVETAVPEREKMSVPVTQDGGPTTGSSDLHANIPLAPPFGLPSVTELLKVLLSLLDPQAQQQLSRAHTDSLLIPSLTTLNVVFSTSGPMIARFPTLRALVLDTGCKCLLQLARSDNPTVLSLALRTIATIFETMRPHLKLQQELLFSFLIDKLTPPPDGGNGRTRLGITPNKKQAGASSTASTSDMVDRGNEKGDEGDEDADSSRPASRAGRAGVVPARGETRELMLETLGHLSRYPEFMVDVWVNYDCDINCEDVFERLIGFLVKVSDFKPSL
jgi:brefeldin A-resistance guanine nucleotide exchange factor 1